MGRDIFLSIRQHLDGARRVKVLPTLPLRRKIAPQVPRQAVAAPLRQQNQHPPDAEKAPKPPFWRKYSIFRRLSQQFYRIDIISPTRYARSVSQSINVILMLHNRFRSLGIRLLRRQHITPPIYDIVKKDIFRDKIGIFINHINGSDGDIDLRWNAPTITDPLSGLFEVFKDIFDRTIKPAAVKGLKVISSEPTLKVSVADSDRDAMCFP